MGRRKVKDASLKVRDLSMRFGMMDKWIKFYED